MFGYGWRHPDDFAFKEFQFFAFNVGDLQKSSKVMSDAAVLMVRS